MCFGRASWGGGRTGDSTLTWGSHPEVFFSGPPRPRFDSKVGVSSTRILQPRSDPQVGQSGLLLRPAAVPVRPPGEFARLLAAPAATVRPPGWGEQVQEPFFRFRYVAAPVRPPGCGRTWCVCVCFLILLARLGPGSTPRLGSNPGTFFFCLRPAAAPV